MWWTLWGIEMTNGYEQGYYNDISRICGYLQSIASELQLIRKTLEGSKWFVKLKVVIEKRNLILTNGVIIIGRNRNEI